MECPSSVWEEGLRHKCETCPSSCLHAYSKGVREAPGRSPGNTATEGEQGVSGLMKQEACPGDGRCWGIKEGQEVTLLLVSLCKYRRLFQLKNGLFCFQM